MNKIFKVIWNTTQGWIVVSELSKTEGKSSLSTNKRIELVKVLSIIGVCVLLSCAASQATAQQFATINGHLTVTGNTLFQGDVTVEADNIVNMGGNKINNVKAGVADTDAVNVSQLKNSGWNLVADGTSSAELINPSDTVTFKAGTNLEVVRNGANITYKTVDDATFTNITATGSITATGGMTVGGDLSTGGMTVGGELSVAGDTLFRGGIMVDGMQTVDMGDNQVNNVKAGTADTDAVNVKQLKDAVNNSGWKLIADGTNGDELINPSDTVTFKAGSNLKVVREGTDITYQMTENVSVNGITANSLSIGSVNITSTGINAGDQVITNVANGAITPTSTDAINGSQLYALGGNINNQINQVAGRVEQIGKQADRGAAIAGAIGMLPQPHLPGKSFVAVATTRYRGQQAAAIGYSRLSDNGKHIIKVSGSTGVNGGAGSRSTMVGAAYGYQW